MTTAASRGPRPTAIDTSDEAVALTRRSIGPAFLDSPQFEAETLGAAVGRGLTVKIETANPIRSFKARGVSAALGGLPAASRIVCASSGNFGQAAAYVGRERGMSVKIYVPRDVNPVKRARMLAFGADLVAVDDLATARKAARDWATKPGRHLIADGSEPAIAQGAATIAHELAQLTTPFDAVVLPVGDGSLITGVGAWMRHHRPDVQIVGVNPASAPAMHRSVAAGRPVEVTVPKDSSLSEGISIPKPHRAAVANVGEVADDIVLVDDDEIFKAMILVARHLSVLPEPAGAAGLAAIAAGRCPGGAVATVITGASPHPSVVARLAAELARPGCGSPPAADERSDG